MKNKQVKDCECKERGYGHGEFCIKEDKNDWEKEFDKLFGRYQLYEKTAGREWIMSLSFVKNFIRFLLKEEKELTRQEVIEEIINELGSNPNEDGSVSPNLQHWIERKQYQLKKKFLLTNLANK